MWDIAAGQCHEDKCLVIHCFTYDDRLPNSSCVLKIVYAAQKKKREANKHMHEYIHFHMHSKIFITTPKEMAHLR